MNLIDLLFAGFKNIFFAIAVLLLALPIVSFFPQVWDWVKQFLPF